MQRDFIDTAVGRGRELLAAVIPPARFPPALERDYRAAVDRTARDVRRGSLYVVLAIWLLHIVWDNIHHHPGDLFYHLKALRVVGAVAIVGGLVAMRIKAAWVTALIGGINLTLYICALLALILVGYLHYLFYYPSLSLLMMLMCGLFRMPARAIAAILFVELCLSFVVLGFAQQIVGLLGVERSTNFIAGFGKQHGAPIGGGMGKDFKHGIFDTLHEAIGSFGSFSTVGSLYLALFAVAGLVIAVERERLSRETFAREHELSENNAALLASERTTAVKTDALVKAENALRETAERRNAEKTAFLRNLAHDLRNALFAVVQQVASARAALARDDRGRSAAALDHAEEAAGAATRTLRSVLDMASLESEQVKPDYTAFALAPILRAVTAVSAGQAEERGVGLRLRRCDDAVAVRSDAVLLERLIGNIFSNAVKYSDPAKGARQQVLLGVVVFPRRVRVDIVDNGIGIARADWGRVFDPFVQLGNPQRDRDRGVGLGLSIANAIWQRLAEHRLDMRSTPGSGTRFSIEIPRAPDLAPASGPAGVEAATHELAQSYCLFVEDDRMVREATLDQLQRTGMLCDGFASLAALEAELPEIERPPDLILTDWRLSDGCTGADVIARVRAQFGGDIPAIVLTGEIGALPLGDIAGARPRVLQKPVTPPELIDALAAAISPVSG
ncbi:ATP-binding response regulator [Sphingomonas sp.]|uniref:ATP-binding response regulator n=1 Tax=Sphingomonas sp. TaxID=28214 RepID=UPI003CC50430